MKTELEFLKYIKSEINSAKNGEGISFNLRFIVKDVDDRIKEVDAVTKKGQETLKELKEFMETLKDFDTWKEWKNTDPIEPVQEVEWDDSHELNNVMNKMLEELNSWEEVTNGALYYDILDKTQNLEPVDYGNSLHCHHSDFVIDNYTYRLTWTIGGAINEEPIIERKIN